MVEKFDLLDANRKSLGRTAERGSRLAIGEYHVVAMALMVNPSRKILITRRSSKKTEAGKWECTAGSVVTGETSKNAIIREIKEEIGIDVAIMKENPIRSFFDEDAIFDIWEIPIISDIEELVLQADEVDEARYATIEEIELIVESGQGTNALKEILKVLQEKSTLRYSS
jgi:mutator protein MutT